MDYTTRLLGFLEPLWARTHPKWNETDHPANDYDNRVKRWREYPLEPGTHDDHDTVRTRAHYGPFRVYQCRDCVEHYRVIEGSNES